MTQRTDREPAIGGEDAALTRAFRATLGGRRVLFLGWGTSGHKMAVNFKAWLVRLFGRVPAPVRTLAFDVDVRQEAVWVAGEDQREGGEPVSLEPELEFVRMGRDLDVERLAVETERNPGLHPETLALLRLQPDGRWARSLERGAEGEPLYGTIAGRWSAGAIRSALRRCLRQLLDLRLAADDGPSRGITVIIAGSLAGGCGAPNLLLAAKEIKEALHDMGVDPGAALVIEMAVLPEAFPETDLRFAVTWKMLQYQSAAFAAGVLPFASEQTPPGRPFDIALLASAVSETGRTLRGIDDLASALALASAILGAYPLREAAAGAWANVVRRMEKRLPDGEPMCFSSLGVFSYRFAGSEVGSYFAHRLAELFLNRLLDGDAAGAEEAVTMTFAAHLPDLDALMHRLHHDADGRPLLGDLDREVTVELRRRPKGPRQLLQSLRDLEAAFTRRAAQATLRAAETMAAVAEGLAAAMEEGFRSLLDSRGPRQGMTYLERFAARLDLLISSLEGQREAVKGHIAESAEARRQAGERIDSLASARWWRRGRGLREALQRYAAASVKAAYDGFALDVIDLVVQSLVEVRQRCGRQLAAAENLLGILDGVRQRCRGACQSFERGGGAQAASVERALHDPVTLKALFADVTGCSWERLSSELSGAIAREVAPLSGWLEAGEEEVYQSLKGIAADRLRHVYTMTADGYVAWRCQREGLNPQAFLRDALQQAAPLCRYERARLPEEDDLADSTFRLVGVPDPESSVFNGVPDVMLVGTYDPDRLVLVTVRVGLPASALWRALRYRSAYQRVRDEGLVALDIYPGYPPRKRNPAGRGGRQARTRRRTSDG